MDPRKILGVSADASLPEIQQAYRAAVAKHHPDMGGDAWAFQQVSEAYNFLIGELDGSNAIKSKRRRSPSNPTQRSESKQSKPPKSKPEQSKARQSKPEQSKPRQSNSPGPNESMKKQHDPRKPQPPTKPKPATQPDKSGLSPANLLTGHLPLQNETTLFILINVLDIFMTYMILQFGGLESNPIANFFFVRWNIRGMIAFKLTIVTGVCVTAQIVAMYKMRSAKFLLNFGSAAVGVVVVYSVTLLVRKLL